MRADTRGFVAVPQRFLLGQFYDLPEQYGFKLYLSEVRPYS